MNPIQKHIEKIRDRRARAAYLKRMPNTYEVSEDIVKKAHRLGFTTDEWTIFSLDENDPKEYLSEYERVRYGQSIGKLRTILDNKIVASLLISHFARTNHIYAYKINNVYQSLDPEYGQERIVERLKEKGRLVFKIESGSVGGKGFRLLEYEDGEFKMNRKPCKAADIEHLLRDEAHYLIEDFCRQNAFEMAIFPDAVNTLRIVTAQHKDGSFEILAAMHRMGAVANTCVDNAGPGGLFCHIDIETGELSSAESYSPELWKDREGKRRFFPVHPVTGFRLEGTRIPDWENIRAEILALHEKMIFTGLKFVAWDIALTDEGPTVIEANSSCGLHFVQTRHGQRNGKIGKWFHEMGLI